MLHITCFKLIFFTGLMVEFDGNTLVKARVDDFSLLQAEQGLKSDTTRYGVRSPPVSISSEETLQYKARTITIITPSIPLP